MTNKNKDARLTVTEYNDASLSICPRCRGYIPNNQQPGAYPGALSRRTRATESPPKYSPPIYVCSPCGLEEALEDRDGTRKPWPIASTRTRR